jgi:hypothetical protein
VASKLLVAGAFLWPIEVRPNVGRGRDIIPQIPQNQACQNAKSKTTKKIRKIVMIKLLLPNIQLTDFLYQISFPKIFVDLFMMIFLFNFKCEASLCILIMKLNN